MRKSGYNFSNIVDNWSKIVGEKISSSCYPNSVKIGKKLSNGLLIVNVIHGKELDIEYSKKEIIDKINSFYGYNYIEEIKLKLINNNNSSRLKTPSKMNVENFEISANLRHVKDGKLKNSLEKLLKAFKNKK